MFIQQQQQQGGTMAARGGFNQAQNVLQGPLAYLEKTTSNIDLVGIGDGRRWRGRGRGRGRYVSNTFFYS